MRLAFGSAALPAHLRVHQQRNRNALDGALRQPDMLDRVAGLVADALGTPRHGRAPGRRPRRWIRKIRRRARQTGRRSYSADVLGFLRGHHDGLVGVEGLLALVGAGEIALHRRGGAKLVGAQQRFQRAVDLGEQVVFDLLPVVERGLGRARRPRPAACRARFSRLPRMSTTETASGRQRRRPRWLQAGRWPRRFAPRAERRAVASPARWPWRAGAIPETPNPWPC